MNVANDNSAPSFDALGFIREFEAVGGKVISDGRSFAVVYPAETDIIPLALIDWGAVVASAHDRAIYGAEPSC